MFHSKNRSLWSKSTRNFFSVLRSEVKINRPTCDKLHSLNYPHLRFDQPMLYSTGDGHEKKLWMDRQTEGQTGDYYMAPIKHKALTINWVERWEFLLICLMTNQCISHLNFFPASGDFYSLLITFANSLDQIRPTFCRAWSGSKLFATLMVFRKDFFLKS